MHAPACYETHHRGGDALDTHRHREAYAALVLDGAYLETSVDGPVLCEPGTLLLHPRFHAHGNRFRGRGARVVNLVFDAPLAIERACALRVDLCAGREAFMSGDAAALAALIAHGEALPAANAGGWQHAMLRALHDGDAPAGRIAARLGVSAAHASRALTRDYGMGPQALRRELRWRRALALLQGDAPLADVAALAGFADQSHFNRVARACSGMTPRQLRRQVKCVQDGAGARAA